jgi:predicted nucleotide-binding protein
MSNRNLNDRLQGIPPEDVQLLKKDGSYYVNAYFPHDADTIVIFLHHINHVSQRLQVGDVIVRSIPDAEEHYTVRDTGYKRAFAEGPTNSYKEHYEAVLEKISIDGNPVGAEPSHSAEPTREQPMPVEDPRKVFVVYGRNEKIRKAMFVFLRSIGLQPLEWGDLINATGVAAPYIGDILDKGFAIAQAVVVVLTPDEYACLRPELRGAHDPPEDVHPTPQARPNVLFEAGMAFGRHPDRTVLVEVGYVRPFSDKAGRHVVRFDGSVRARQDLAHRLQAAQCPVNMTGDDWHDAGDFSMDYSTEVIRFVRDSEHPPSTGKLPKSAEPIRVEVTKWSHPLRSSSSRRNEYRAVTYRVYITSEEVTFLKQTYPDTDVDALVEEVEDGMFELMPEDHKLEFMGLGDYALRVDKVVKEAERKKSR